MPLPYVYDPDDVKHVVLGMPHRGRNNLLTTMLNVRPAKFFKKYQGNSEFSTSSGAMGDVASHYGKIFIFLLKISLLVPS